MLFIDNNKVSMVICLNCFARWIAARPMETMLDQLECPICGTQGTAIETGEIGIEKILLERARESAE